MFSDHDVLRQLVEFLAEVIRRALKLKREGKTDEAAQLVRQSTERLFGMEFRVLAMLDAPSAVSLLGTKERARAFLSLIEALVEIEGGERAEHTRALARAIDERF